MEANNIEEGPELLNIHGADHSTPMADVCTINSLELIRECPMESEYCTELHSIQMVEGFYERAFERTPWYIELAGEHRSRARREHDYPSMGGECRRLGRCG